MSERPERLCWVSEIPLPRGWDTAVPTGGTTLPHLNTNVPPFLTRVDTPSHAGHDPTPRYPHTPRSEYSGTTPRILRYPRTSAMIATPNSDRSLEHPPDATPRTIPRPSHTRPTSPADAALPCLAEPAPVRQGVLGNRPAAGPAHPGWDAGFAGQQAGDDSVHLQTLGASTVPRPATPLLMQGVQRYPAVFASAPGPFWWGTEAGYSSIWRGNDCCRAGC